MACLGHPDHTAAAFAVWSVLHGYVALEDSGAFGGFRAQKWTGGGHDSLFEQLPEWRRLLGEDIRRGRQAFGDVRSHEPKISLEMSLGSRPVWRDFRPTAAWSDGFRPNYSSSVKYVLNFG